MLGVAVPLLHVAALMGTGVATFWGGTCFEQSDCRAGMVCVALREGAA